MARPGPATQAKRQRERKKKEKRQAKLERRALRKEQKAQRVPPNLKPDEDPDLIGIIPGPQPPILD